MMEKKKWTHAELVEIAAKWAAKRHGVVVKEFHCYTLDIPDVFAFNGAYSTMIEVKTSRSDFHADKKKGYRRDEFGWAMSNYKIYCAPKGLLDLDKDIPEKWGLLEVDDNGKAKIAVNVFRGPTSIFYFESTKFMALQERKILYSIARRATLQGFMPKITEPLIVRWPEK